MKVVGRAAIILVCSALLLLAVLAVGLSLDGGGGGYISPCRDPAGNRQDENATHNGTTADNDSQEDEEPASGFDKTNEGVDGDLSGEDDYTDGGSQPPPADDGDDDFDDDISGEDPGREPGTDGGEPPSSSWTDLFKQPGVLIAAGLLIGAVIVFMAIFLVYTKIKHDQLLDHKMRESIYKHIEKHPGQHFRSILKDMGLKSGVLTHHINMLEREEYIKSVQDGIYRRFYIYGAKTDGKPLLNQHQQNILNAVKAKPGMSQTEIANQLGITRMLVNYHLKVLTSEKLVRIKKKGRSSSCYPVEENT